MTEWSGLIWLDSVPCNGTEARLIDCPANATGSSNCTQVQLAGIYCTGEFNAYDTVIYCKSGFTYVNEYIRSDFEVGWLHNACSRKSGDLRKNDTLNFFDAVNVYGI